MTNSPSSSSPRLVGRSLLTAFSLSLLGAILINCGGDEEGPQDDLALGDDDLGIGDGDGDVAGIPSSQEGGRTELTSEQVDRILGAECTGWSGEGESLPATLQLVIDVSGSMNQPPPGQNGRSKWEITRDALEAAVDSLPPSVAVGALYYPNKTVSSNSSSDPGPVSDCVNVSETMPLDVLGTDGSAQRNAFANSLRSVSVDSYTPTHDAYEYALDNELVPYQGPNKFMLLITDGAPTIEHGCSWPVEPAVIGPTQNGDGAHDGETDVIIDDIHDAFLDHGVRTFLIGAPGSEQSVESGTDKRPWLSEAAVLGGTPLPDCEVEGPNYCHFDMTQSTDFASELRAGLATIAGQIVDQCVFAVPDAPSGDGKVDPALTQLIIEWGDGSKSLIHGDGSGGCEDGWVYDDDEETVELCEQTCDELRTDNGARVHVSFGCTQEQVEEVVR